ncbi:hypothetical protein DPMN_162093 [Dreissena polymorpha]|uniref:Uncharacterized protein n=1 Tax=Dreissena polymorpha TaxID=45954 RepID=A0A9D4EQV0_DREPO|nr:hypothetical protein DPMN_162093 [Dreissena polymorpha]
MWSMRVDFMSEACVNGMWVEYEGMWVEYVDGECWWGMRVVMWVKHEERVCVWCMSVIGWK